MTDITNLRNLFIDYADSYINGEKEHDFSITLKKEHSLLVSIYSGNIAELEKISSNEVVFAAAAGLLHDIGRFEQYKKYRTFHDAVSVDHGDLGADILLNSQFASHFNSEELSILVYAVKNHNKKEFPKTNDYKELITRIIRDADKLDIFRVLTEMMNPETGGTLTHHLPDVEEYSDDIIEDILEGKQVCYTRRKTRNDVRLTMLNWIQDLSFEYSFRHIVEKNYVETVCSYLPKTEKIQKVKNHINSFIETKLSEK